MIHVSRCRSRGRQHCASTHGNTLQHAATHCNTLQHTATRCSTLQHTATHCNTLLHTAATHCNTLLQHTATHCNTLQHTAGKPRGPTRLAARHHSKQHQPPVRAAGSSEPAASTRTHTRVAPCGLWHQFLECHTYCHSTVRCPLHTPCHMSRAYTSLLT